jgi:hypothetical protein
MSDGEQRTLKVQTAHRVNVSSTNPMPVELFAPADRRSACPTGAAVGRSVPYRTLQRRGVASHVDIRAGTGVNADSTRRPAGN